MGWLSGWAIGKRIEITADCSVIDNDLTHFPITLFLNSSAGKTSADITRIFDELGSDANRFKIAVTKADGETQLYVEIELWDDANEKAILHVSRSGWTITNESDTNFCIYYDSSHADNTDYVGGVGSTPGKNVWDSDYVAVWHLKDTESVASMSDDFDDNIIDRQLWKSQTLDASGYITEEDGVLKMGLINGSHGDSGQLYTSGSYALSGDFDVQIDFELIAAPSANDWQFLLDMKDASLQEEVRVAIEYSIGVRRYKGEIRHNGLPEPLEDQNTGYSYTDDSSGKLRITRVGTTAYTYFWDTDHWTLIFSDTIGDSEDMWIRLWIYTALTAPNIEIELNNLIINSGTVVGSPWLSLEDSTSNANVGVKVLARNSPVQSTIGQMGRCQLFDGDDYIGVSDETGGFDFGSGDFSVEFWFRTGATDDVIIQKKLKRITAADPGFSIYTRASNPYLQICIADGANTLTFPSWATAFADSAWHGLGVTYDGEGNEVWGYLDGVQKANNSVGAMGSISNNHVLEIGRSQEDGTPERYLAARLDELRLSRATRSPAWMKASHYTQADNLLTYSKISYQNTGQAALAIIGDLIYGEVTEIRRLWKLVWE